MKQTHEQAELEAIVARPPDPEPVRRHLHGQLGHYGPAAHPAAEGGHPMSTKKELPGATNTEQLKETQHDH